MPSDAAPLAPSASGALAGPTSDAQINTQASEAPQYIDPCFRVNGLYPWTSLNLSRPTFLVLIRFPLTIVLVLARLIAIFFLCVFVWMWCYLWTICAKPPVKPEDPPLHPIRVCAIQMVVRVVARLGLWVGGFYWISVTRHPGSIAKFQTFASEDERANIIVCNHVCPLGDIMFNLYAHCPGFVAKISVADVPFIGTIAKSIQSVFISRGDKSSKEVTKELLIQRGQKGSVYPQVLIFPEGTTTNATSVLDFKVGAFLSGCRVQPVALRYPFCSFSPSWSSESAAYNLLMTLAQFWNCMEVIYLPIYEPTAEEQQNPKLFARNVQKEIALALSVPASNYALEQLPSEHVELRTSGWEQWSMEKGGSPPIPKNVNLTTGEYEFDEDLTISLPSTPPISPTSGEASSASAAEDQLPLQDGCLEESNDHLESSPRIQASDLPECLDSAPVNGESDKVLSMQDITI